MMSAVANLVSRVSSVLRPCSGRSVCGRRGPTLAAVLCLLLVPGMADGGGADFSGREDDILITADWRWAGGHGGGYYPIRVFLQNAGRSRTVDVVFQAGSSGLPNVSRRVRMDAGGSARLTLPVPLVGEAGSGQLVFLVNDQELTSLRTPIRLPDAHHGDCPIGILVIHESPLELTELRTAVSSLAGHGSSSQRRSECEQIEPVHLPASWVSYLSVDLLLVTPQTLNRLDVAQRDAILNWTRTGGCLALFSADGAADGDTAMIDRLLEEARDGADEIWQPVSPQFRQRLDRVEPDSFGSAPSGQVAGSAEFRWPDDESALLVRDFGLGRVVRLPAAAFSGTYLDWAWMLGGIRFQQQVLPTRLGVSGRTGNADFLSFLIPGVRGVPVVTFSVVISVFALLIGPVNYYLLARQNCQGFLVVTIPLIALLSTLAIFAWSFVAHGISVRSRIRSVTWIDQSQQQAVSMARIAWFAGFAPSDGLRFSASTAFIPIWHQESQFGNGHVDWTESQRLVRGFLRSRTRTQAITVSVRDERGRLNISPSAPGGPTPGLTVSNGFEWPFSALIVWDDAGQAFLATQVEAGQVADLKPLTESGRSEFLQRMNQSVPVLPPDLVPGRSGFFEMNRSRGQAGRYSVAQGQMERQIAALQRSVQVTTPAKTRRYMGICEVPPGIDPGTDVEIVDGWHLVVGSW